MNRCAVTHHVDSSRKDICRFDHLLLLLYLRLQLGSTNLVLGDQDGGGKLRLLLDQQMGFEVLGDCLMVCEVLSVSFHMLALIKKKMKTKSSSF